MPNVTHGRITKQTTTKRRRPAKKLKADIGSLADALPDVADPPAAQQQQQQQRHADGTTMKMKSLRHRPGAMKRKQKMHRTETERFAKNLAQLVQRSATAPAEDARASGGDEVAAGAGAHADRWAALRRFIGVTMEKDRAFREPTGKA